MHRRPTEPTVSVRTVRKVQVRPDLPWRVFGDVPTANLPEEVAAHRGCWHEQACLGHLVRSRLAGTMSMRQLVNLSPQSVAPAPTTAAPARDTDIAGRLRGPGGPKSTGDRGILPDPCAARNPHRAHRVRADWSHSRSVIRPALADGRALLRKPRSEKEQPRREGAARRTHCKPRAASVRAG